jgi:hypothetical protein
VRRAASGGDTTFPTDAAYGTIELHVYLLASSGLTISASELTFPAVGITFVSAPQTLTVTNIGSRPISLIGLSISGLNANDFSNSGGL